MQSNKNLKNYKKEIMYDLETKMRLIGKLIQDLMCAIDALPNTDIDPAQGLRKEKLGRILNALFRRFTYLQAQREFALTLTTITHEYAELTEYIAPLGEDFGKYMEEIGVVYKTEEAARETALFIIYPEVDDLVRVYSEDDDLIHFLYSSGLRKQSYDEDLSQEH